MPPRVVCSETLLQGGVISVRRDVVDLGAGGTVTREVVEHPGAVGIVALNADNEVLLVRQYRHPLGARLWELPAGLLDVKGEATVEAAKRELAEEGKVSAGRWQRLLIAHTSPGMTDERIEVFLAEEIETFESSFEAEGEEVELETRWVGLPTAVEYVDRGDITNGMAVMGLLAAARELARRET